MIYKLSIHTVKKCVKKIVIYHKIHFWLQGYFSVACQNNLIAVQLDFYVLSPTPGPERSVGKLRRTNPYQTRMSVCTRPGLVLKTPGMPMWSEVSQSCPILWDPMDCSPPGSSVHGIFQARVLEWVAISFSRGSSQPRDWTRVSCTAGRHFTVCATREAQACPGTQSQ